MTVARMAVRHFPLQLGTRPSRPAAIALTTKKAGECRFLVGGRGREPALSHSGTEAGRRVNRFSLGWGLTAMSPQGYMSPTGYITEGSNAALIRCRGSRPPEPPPRAN